MCGRSSGTVNPQAGKLRVLLDGWPLIAGPASPASFHIWELLRAGDQAGVEIRVALPELDRTPHAAANTALPPWVVTRRLRKYTPDGRLKWEQRLLPELARETDANLIHSLTGSLPVASPTPCVISPTGFDSGPGGAMMTRIVAAFGRGGSSRARAVFWPEDLPDPQEDAPALRLPNFVHPAFSRDDVLAADVPPEPYIFCPGPVRGETLELLAAAWRWICGGLGEDWTLAVDGISPADLEDIRLQSGSAAQVWASLSGSPGERAGWMRKAAVVLLVNSPIPWGDPLLQALASGRPVVAQETAWNALRAGPAAYLTPPGDARMLGAAAITLAVEEEVADGLAEAAKMRAEQLLAGDFPARLKEAYLQVAG